MFKMKSVLIYFIMLFMLSSNMLYADDFSDAMIKIKKKLKENTDNSEQGLLKIRGDFERILQLKKNQWLVNYYMGMVDMLISYQMAEKKDNDAVKKYTESSIDMLNKVSDLKDDFAEAYILKYAVISNRWMYEPNKMNDIIAAQTEAKNLASKYDPDNPRLYLVEGINTYYTPEMFGGGVDKAQPLLEKSYELYKTYKPVDETYPNWGKDQVCGYLALCCIKNDKLDDAKSWIDKGLKEDPDSDFIKNQVQKEYDKKAGK
jgi:tetratricopeptide (TPR) repeat protein